MKKLFLIGSILLFIPHILFSQKYSPTEIKEDLVYLKHQLDKIHPNPYRYTPQNNFEDFYQKKLNGVEDSMTASEAYRYMAEVMHLVHDAHTAFYMGNAHKKRNNKEFPFRFYPDSNQVKLRFNFSDDSLLREGWEVVEMNGKPIDKYLDDFSNQILTDYGLYDRRTAILNFPIFYTRNFGNDSSFSLTFRSNEGDTLIKKTFKCLSPKKMERYFKKRYPNKPSSNLSLKFIDSLKTAILTVSSFRYGKSYDVPQWQFNKRIKKVFDSLAINKCEHLIIDARGNRGGFVSNPPRIIKRLYNQPFTLTDTVSFKKGVYFRNMATFMPFALPLGWLYFKPNNGVFTHSYRSNSLNKPDKKRLFKGKVYFLMDSESYSATSQLLSKSHNLGIGTYIGEPCGGAYWGCYALQKVTKKLPNTKFEMIIPTCMASHNVDLSKANGKTVQPNYYVTRKDEHWWTWKNDKIMEKALELIKSEHKAK